MYLCYLCILENLRHMAIVLDKQFYVESIPGAGVNVYFLPKKFKSFEGTRPGYKEIYHVAELGGLPPAHTCGHY